ncbi:MAG: Rubrerythrin [Armatimonadetes bacterium]|nr:Rubrerythrin [Armatimonadota bacterium]
MPAFPDPFYGNVPDRKMALGELVRALRLNVAAEEEAAALYEAHADATDNPLARKVLIDIANEERVHVGEFIQLINILSAGDEIAWMQNGYEEVREMAEAVARGDLEPDTPAEKAAKEHGLAAGGNGNGNAATIGSMK